MQDKGLYVSQQDIRRYELLQKVLEESLTLAVAAPALGVSYRQAKRLKAKVMAQGLPGLLHGNRGRLPHNRCEQARLAQDHPALGWLVEMRRKLALLGAPA